MRRHVIGVVDLAQCGSNPNSQSQSHNNARTIYTFFRNGFIVELPTRWVRSISFEPRYSPQTVSQYSHNVKDFLVWLCDSDRYQGLSLDDLLVAVNRRDLQEWILDRKAAQLESSTLRNREIPVKLFIEWLTTQEAGRVRTTENTPYKTGKLISPTPHRRKPQYISAELMIRLIAGYHNESERCLAHALFDTGLRISEVQRLRKQDLPDPSLFPNGLKYYPLRVQGSKGHGGRIKERIALISSPVLARIGRYHNTSEYRFSPFWQNGDPDKPAFLSVNGRSICPRNVRSQMDLAAVRMNLQPSLFSPHRLRHGAAFSILTSELGRDYFDKLFLVQQLFGHKSITTTEIYTVVPPAVLAKLCSDRVVIEKYDEAKRVYAATYLSPSNHTEVRGHR
jgi:site-specific recombinase XerD